MKDNSLILNFKVPKKHFPVDWERELKMLEKEIEPRKSQFAFDNNGNVILRNEHSDESE